MTAQAADIATAWWRALQPYTADGKPNRGGDRAALAHLRRATVTEAMDEPATFALFRSLGRSNPRDLVEAALCAAVLATVRESRPGHPARILGPAPGGGVETAIMHPLRFRRLIQATGSEDRLMALRRAIQLADRKLSVRGLATACLFWTETTRRTWIFNYYNAGSAAPDAPDADPAAPEEPAP